MQKHSRILGVVVALLVGSLVGVGMRVFGSPPAEEAPPPQVNLAELTPRPLMTPETPFPTIVLDPDATPLIDLSEPPVNISGTPLPTVPAPQLDKAPEQAQLAADETVVFASDFSTADLEGWQFGQIEEGRPADDWEVSLEPPYNEVLIAPPDMGSSRILNDMLAVAPAQLSGDGAVEVSINSRMASTAGLLIGYQDEQNYAAMIFGAENASTHGVGKPGLIIVQVVDGNSTVLAHNTTAEMQYGTWYRLRLETAGDTLSASVDGGEPLTATLPTASTGQGVGIYAGFDGFIFFDDIQVTTK
jgi:hypothetical protein